MTRGDNSDDNSDAGDISSLSSLRPHHHSRSANTNTPARNNNNVSRVTINNKNCRVVSAQTQTDWRRTPSRSSTSDIPCSDATCADINNPSIHDNITSQFRINFSRYCLAPSYWQRSGVSCRTTGQCLSGHLISLYNIVKLDTLQHYKTINRSITPGVMQLLRINY